jgi:hypothetical protein
LILMIASSINMLSILIVQARAGIRREGTRRVVIQLEFFH